MTVTTPASDVATACRRDRSAVRPLEARFTSGRRPAHVPVTSLVVMVPEVEKLIARSRYSMSSVVHAGSSRGPS